MNTGETCDQGSNNRTAGDGCDASCQIEQGYSCGRQGNVSVCSPLCGNGVLNPGETCDQGSNNRTSGDGCSNVCSIEANFRCTGTPSFCISYTDYVRALAGITSMDTDPDAISRKILDLQIRMVLDPITAIYDINNDGVYVDSNGIMNATDYGIINDQLESISPTPTTSN
jgi:cysteine-rich repeat protein